jgi:hypothetical protein
MLWLRWFEVDDAKLLWAWDERVAWKQITWQFGLAVIVWRLNGRRVPTRRSMAYVIDGAR